MMAARSDTALNESLITLREQKRLFDDLWLLSLFVMLLALGVPWFLRVLAIDFASVAWSLFIYGVLFLAISMAANSLEDRRLLLGVIGGLQASGIIFVGYLWHLSGGVQDPMFLLVFVMPVLAGSLVLPNWQNYVAAALSATCVTGIAIFDAPELRWYLVQMRVLSQALADRFPRSSAHPMTPFPGLSLTPAYIFVVLVMFALMIFMVAWTSEYLSGLLIGLYGRLATSTAGREETESLSLEVLRASPSPIALVYADTLNVAHVSHSFLHQFLLTPESLLHKNLLGLVEFSYPEVVEGLIRGNGGDVPLAPLRVGTETKFSRIVVHSISHGSTRYAYVSFQDIADLHYSQAALGAVAQALLVVNSSRQVLYFNQAAKELFGDLRMGIDAAILMQQANLPTGWWELGNRSRQERRVEFAGRRFLATCVASPILGGQDLLTVLNLQPTEGRG